MASTFLENPVIAIEVDKTSLEAKSTSRFAKISNGGNLTKDVILAEADQDDLNIILGKISNTYLTGDGGIPSVLAPTALALGSKRGLTYESGSRWIRVPEQFNLQNPNDNKFVIQDFNEFLISISTGAFPLAEWQIIDDGGTNVVNLKSREAATAHWFLSPVDLSSFGNWKLTFKIKNPTTDPESLGNVFRFGLGRKRWLASINQTQQRFSNPNQAGPYAGDFLNTYMSWGDIGGTNHQFKVYRYNSDFTKTRTQIGVSASEYPIAYYKISIEKTDTQIIYTVDVDGAVNTESFSINLVDMVSFKELFLVIGMLTDTGGLCEVNIENLEIAINGHGTGAVFNSDYRILAQLRSDTGAIQRLTYEGLNIVDSNSNLITSPGARLFTAGQNAIDLQTSLTAIWNKIKADEGIT